MSRVVTAALRVSPLVALLFTAATVAAQQPAGELARQSLRPYWHVFVAYAITIVVVMVWAGSIARRLADVEARLGE
jgi:hypothetical protein